MADILHCLGRLDSLERSYGLARAELEAALTIRGELKDGIGFADTLCQLGELDRLEYACSTGTRIRG